MAVHEQSGLPRERHPLAGEKVTLIPALEMQGVIKGAEYVIEDWWQNVYGKSWMLAQGNPAALIYGIRSGLGNLPTDDEVVYGKIDGLGYLVHVSEFK